VDCENIHNNSIEEKVRVDAVLKMKYAKACKFADACHNVDCKFVHGPNRKLGPCHFGDKCTRNGCSYSHPTK
jgi:hypothetical protein